MKITLLALTFFLSLDSFAVSTVKLQHWVSPTFEDYDFRCININEDHYRYKWRAYGKFFSCPEIPFTQEYQFECLSLMIVNTKNELIKRATLSRGIPYMWGVFEEFKASLDLEHILYFFDLHYFAENSQINRVEITKIPDQVIKGGYEAGILFQDSEAVVSGFPALCQFKNHFPERED